METVFVYRSRLENSGAPARVVFVALLVAVYAAPWPEVSLVRWQAMVLHLMAVSWILQDHRVHADVNHARSSSQNDLLVEEQPVGTTGVHPILAVSSAADHRQQRGYSWTARAQSCQWREALHPRPRRNLNRD